MYHKAECKGISRISPSIPTDTVRLIVRLLVGKSNGIRTVVGLLIVLLLSDLVCGYFCRVCRKGLNGTWTF